MTCRYCGGDAKLCDSFVVYGKSYGLIWLCECGARVGAQKDGTPKGVLANGRLRKARQQFHDAIDPLWKADVPVDLPSKARKKAVYRARGRIYKRLAELTGLPEAEVHGGFLTEETIDIVCQAAAQIGDERVGL
jgi:hypothetical protein